MCHHCNNSSALQQQTAVHILWEKQDIAAQSLPNRYPIATQN